MFGLLTGGRDIKRKERQEIASLLGVTEKSTYRYSNRVGRVIFMMGEKKFIEAQKNLQKNFVD